VRLDAERGEDLFHPHPDLVANGSDGVDVLAAGGIVEDRSGLRSR
jgi:hypothetical protein